MSGSLDGPRPGDEAVMEARVPRPETDATRSVSRRELLGWTAAAASASVLGVLPGEAAAHARPALPPGPRALAAPDLTQLQYPFWAGDWRLPYRYETILFADFNGDGQAELL